MLILIKILPLYLLNEVLIVFAQFLSFYHVFKLDFKIHKLDTYFDLHMVCDSDQLNKKKRV